MLYGKRIIALFAEYIKYFILDISNDTMIKKKAFEEINLKRFYNFLCNHFITSG